MKKNKCFPKGLTLIELLVVVMIIMLVLAIGGNTFREQRRQVAYNDGVLKVSNLIKTARNYTLTSRSVYDTCNDTVYVPEYGYGVYIYHSNNPGESRAVLFANVEADNESEQNQYNEVTGSCAASDLVEEEYYLPPEVDFVGLSIDKTQPVHTEIGGGSDDEAVIIFKPTLADAVVAVNDNAPASSLTYLTDLYIQFKRPGLNISTYLHFNQIGGFPEVEQE